MALVFQSILLEAYFDLYEKQTWKKQVKVYLLNLWVFARISAQQKKWRLWNGCIGFSWNTSVLRRCLQNTLIWFSLTSQTKFHWATLCDLVPSCYGTLSDISRLFPSTAKSSTFTVSAVGNKHYERKVDCFLKNSLQNLPLFVIFTQFTFACIRLKFNH